MNEKIPWNLSKISALIIALEGEVTNLLLMLIPDKHVKSINNALDNPDSNNDLRNEVIIQFHSLLKTRIIKATEGKNYAIGYLEKTFKDTSFSDKLFEDYPLSNASYNDVTREMEILKNTVLKNLKSKSFLYDIDTLRVELVELIISYPVDAAMLLTFLISS